MATAQLTVSTDHFELLARYNRGANERLYQASAELSDEARWADRGAFFRSIHATLNHILVGDRIWLARFEGDAAPSTDLDAILYNDFAALWDARRTEDDRIETLVTDLSPSVLDSEIEYVNNEGRLFRDPVRMLLIHIYSIVVHVADRVDMDQRTHSGNHQHHHGGERVEQETELRLKVV